MKNEDRSRIMRAVRSKNTLPELTVRRLVHGLGYRFRLHRKDLAGKPDLVFPSRRKVIFVHGCFWHQHSCREGRIPGSNPEYWVPKLKRNVERDASARAELQAAGWKTLTIWECQTAGSAALGRVLREFLGN